MKSTRRVLGHSCSHPLARLIAQFVHLLAPLFLLRSRTSLRSFILPLAHLYAPEHIGKRHRSTNPMRRFRTVSTHAWCVIAFVRLCLILFSNPFNLRDTFQEIGFRRHFRSCDDLARGCPRKNPEYTLEQERHQRRREEDSGATST